MAVGQGHYSAWGMKLAVASCYHRSPQQARVTASGNTWTLCSKLGICITCCPIVMLLVKNYELKPMQEEILNTGKHICSKEFFCICSQ